MGRMLEALKTLEERRRLEIKHEPIFEHHDPEATLELAISAAAELDEPAPRITRRVPVPRAHFETCYLPIAETLPRCYEQLCERIADQVASNYSNVLLLVSPEGTLDPHLSMTHLAQAFATHSPGDVLLIDGDFRHGRLSRCVSRTGPGMTEAMLGAAQWNDLIHPTNVACIDFVARGNSPVPTLERAEFGWGALRPKYRTILIGVCSATEAETNWLASRCDGVYLVIWRPQTRRRDASAAVSALRASGATVLGCIVSED